MLFPESSRPARVAAVGLVVTVRHARGHGAACRQLVAPPLVAAQTLSISTGTLLTQLIIKNQPRRRRKVGRLVNWS